MKTLSLLPLLALGLGACTTGGSLPPTQVLRYHLPDGVERGTVAVEPARPGLMGQPYEAAVARQLGQNGFPAATGAPSRYIAVVDARRSDHVGPPRPAPFTLGLGGGTFSGGRGGGVGLGGGVGIPIGHARPSTLTATELTVLIKRRADQTTVWEGHANAVTDTRRPGGEEPAVAQKLAAALFAGFPGESGRTITVK